MTIRRTLHTIHLGQIKVLERDELSLWIRNRAVVHIPISRWHGTGRTAKIDHNLWCITTWDAGCQCGAKQRKLRGNRT